MIGFRTHTKAPAGESWVRRHRLAICALAVLGIGLVLAVPVARSGAAQSAGELDARIDAAQQQANDLKSRIQGQTQDLFAAQAQADSAAAREQRLGATLEQGQARAAVLAKKVAAANAELQDQRRHLRLAQEVLADRLVAIYKAGTPDMVSVLLNSDGFDDLNTRYELLSRIEAADAGLVERVHGLASEVSAHLADVAASKQKVDAFNARLERARDRIAAVRAGAEARAAELTAIQGERRDTLAELSSSMDRWTTQLADLEPAPAAAQAVDGLTGDWAIPDYIVMCESGGSYTALNPSSGAGGAYQILPSTWAAYGGKGLPHQAPPAEQDRIAAMIWADSGGSAWVCA